jgi:hypothetical protein
MIVIFHVYAFHEIYDLVHSMYIYYIVNIQVGTKEYNMSSPTYIFSTLEDQDF